MSGCLSKLFRMNHQLAITTYDVLIFQETWFNDEADLSPLTANTNFGLYNLNRSKFNRRNRNRGGGIAILYRNFLDVKKIELPQTMVEIQAIKLNDVVVVNVYSPPHTRQRTKYVDEFTDTVRFIERNFPINYIHVFGDFNHPTVIWDPDDVNPPFKVATGAVSTHDKYFIERISELSIQQVSSLKNNRGTQLDLYFTNSPVCHMVNAAPLVELIDVNSQHHTAFTTVIDTTADVREEINIASKRIVKLRRSAMDTQILSNNLLDELLQEDHEAILVAESFSNGLRDIVNKHSFIAKDFRHSSQSRHPWTTDKDYRRLYNRKRQLTRSIRNQDDEVTVDLATISIQLRQSYQLLKQKYYSNIVNSGFSQSCDFYRFVKSVRKPNQSLPSIMYFQDLTYTGRTRDERMAQSLFSNFKSSKSSFDESMDTVCSQLNDIYQEYYNDDYSHIWNDYQEIFEFSTDEINHAIAELKDSKADGPMDIPVAFFKYHVQVISPIISRLFNEILRTGKFPAAWKNSFLTPIPKRGDLNEITNYRGIAMASTLPKLFDKVFTTKLYGFLTKFLPEEQHGFVRDKNTCTNLFETTNFVSDALANGKQVDAIYFDFSKAFDSISHSILARKLANVSTPNDIYHVIMAFVINRTYTLKVNGSNTEITTLATSGVPQGSHIGPTLFVFYIRDSFEKINHPDIFSRLFADDTKMLSIINTNEDAKLLQKGIDELYRWSIQNKLPLNQQKTKTMSFFKGKNRKIVTRYYIGTTPIQRCSTQMDLGILFDEKLSFRPHMEQLLNRANKILAVSMKLARDLRCLRFFIELTSCRFWNTAVLYGR